MLFGSANDALHEAPHSQTHLDDVEVALVGVVVVEVDICQRPAAVLEQHCGVRM